MRAAMPAPLPRVLRDVVTWFKMMLLLIIRDFCDAPHYARFYLLPAKMSRATARCCLLPLMLSFFIFDTNGHTTPARYAMNNAATMPLRLLLRYAAFATLIR